MRLTCEFVQFVNLNLPTMLCQNCHLRPAAAAITRITSEGRQTLHLCEECATKRDGRRFGGKSFEFFDDFFEPLASFFDFERPPRRARQQTVNVLDYFTSETKMVLQKAVAEAEEAGMELVDTEHLLLALAADLGTVGKILNEIGIKPDELIKELRLSIPRERKEIEEIDLSPRVKKILELAFEEARGLKHNYVGPEHLMLGLLREGEGVAYQILQQHGLTLDKLRAAVVKLVGEGHRQAKAAAYSPTPTLDRYSRDLTKLALEGRLDPVVGRQNEIERVIHILSRRTKNNPVLIGEPGVGKTAIVEGLALRIIHGDVPEVLLGKRLAALDLAGMVAGTKYRGEFEERIKKSVDEIVKAKGEVVLFIDELHTLVGAGAAEGAIDASNILKPFLARGELQTIGATTLGEYKKYIEKDGALERRFQPIIVPENTVEETVEILRGLRDKYEAHHRVKISDEAIAAAGSLSDRYIQDRFLPDKAIDLIDEASAQVRLKVLHPPENLQQAEDKIRSLHQEIEAAQRSKKTEKLGKLEKELEKLEKAKEEIKTLWEKEKGSGQPVVTFEDIAQVLSRMTGIPVTKLSEQEKEKLLKLEERLHERIVNQDEAVKTVSEAIRRARAGLKDPKRPIGSFMFLGPTGVGKTELTKALSEILYGSEEAMVRLDMSEYQEPHTVARLIGSPPGYVGFEEGGQLTEKVRRQPFSIILLDEIEKAHPDVFNLLLQIFEDGRLTDGKGKVVDFKNTILIMTSNLGGALIQRVQTEDWSHEKLEGEMEKILKATFRPEFLNRVDEFILFDALKYEDVLKIVDLLLAQLKRLVKSQNLDFEISQKVKEFLAREGFDPQFGARPLRRVIQREIENRLSEKIIQGETLPGDLIQIDLDEGGNLLFNLVHAANRKSRAIPEARPVGAGVSTG